METEEHAIDEAEMHAHSETVRKVRAEMPSDDELVDIAEFFKVFGDSTRAKILAALAVSECCVAFASIAKIAAEQARQDAPRREGDILFARRRAHRRNIPYRARARERTLRN